jgi:hypothetical protein
MCPSLTTPPPWTAQLCQTASPDIITSLLAQFHTQCPETLQNDPMYDMCVLHYTNSNAGQLS